MAEPIVESANLQVILTGMAKLVLAASEEFQAAAATRVRAWDLLASNAGAAWTIYLQSPSVMAGMGYQAAAGHMPPRQTEAGLAPAAGTGAPTAK